MGNTDTKTEVGPPCKSSSPAVPQEIKSCVEAISNEIRCSICLEIFEDPVSIDCGHNFCRVCISGYWAANSAQGYTCPECRWSCSSNNLVTDVRMNNVVMKVRQGLQDQQEHPEDLGPAGPRQLVGLDKELKLKLSEDVLRICLQRKDIRDHAVCLISVIGEHRKGKSFLLNYILRWLKNQGVKDNSWLGSEDEALEGFEWKPGTDSITKGVWIWSEPIMVDSGDQKIAIFLVDTEGSLDIEQDKETSVKLSAFSMLLSSYLIYNVSSSLKETELENLEMFLHVAEVVGNAFTLEPIQHLNILIRDWSCHPVFGEKAGQEYLNKLTEKLKTTQRHIKSLETLQSSRSSCYLLPYPGKNIVMGVNGTLKDMDSEFKDSLKSYISGPLSSAVKSCVKKDAKGVILTCGMLAGKIKTFVEVMKEKEYGFSSPLEMAKALQNVKALEEYSNKFREAIKEQEVTTDTFIKTLKNTPKTVKLNLENRSAELLDSFQKKLEEDGEEEKSKQKLITVLKGDIKKELEEYSKKYSKKFKSSVIIAGVGVGAAGIGLVGGVAGAAVAGVAVAAETIFLGSGAATVAAGALAGSSSFALLGSGLGATVGNTVGDKERQNMNNATMQTGVNNTEEKSEVVQDYLVMDEEHLNLIKRPSDEKKK